MARIKGGLNRLIVDFLKKESLLMPPRNSTPPLRRAHHPNPRQENPLESSPHDPILDRPTTHATPAVEPRTIRRRFHASSRLIPALLAIGLSASNLPACPTELSSLEINYAACIHRDGNLLFLGSSIDGLMVVDITDPVNPVILDSVGMRSPQSIDTHAGLAYVSNLWTGLSIVDYSNPHELATLSTTELPYWHCGQVSYRHGFVYIVVDTEGVAILDVADPYAPQFAHLVPESPNITDATVHEDHLYVLDAGIHLYSLTDPDGPIQLDNEPYPICGSSIEGGTDLLCSYNFWGQVCMSLIQDPVHPVPYAGFEISSRVQDVSFGHELFAAVSDDQWELVPLGVAEETRTGARIPMDHGRSILLDDGLLFVTDLHALHVYDVSCDLAPLAWFAISPSSFEYGDTCTLDAGSSSDLESADSLIQVRWDLDNDGVHDTEWSTERVLTTRFDTIGDTLATLQVRSANGATSTCTRRLPVGANPAIELVITPEEGTTATTFTFDASGTMDPDDPERELRFYWYFNYPEGPDGPDSLDVVTHRFTEPGDYPLRLRVFDAENRYSSVTDTIHVEPLTITRPVATPPGEFALGAFPNPFNPRTMLEAVIDQPGRATLDVYDLQGRWVRRCLDERLTAGTYMVPFDAGSLATGLYFGVLNLDGRTEVTRLLLLK